MLTKYFDKSIKDLLSPTALNYVNKKGDKIRLYYLKEQESGDITAYGLEFRGYDTKFFSKDLLNGFIENLAFTES